MLFSDPKKIQPIKERVAALAQRIGAKGIGLYISTKRDIAIARVGEIESCTFSELEEVMLFSAQPISLPEQYIRPILTKEYVTGYLQVRIAEEKRSDLVLEILETYADLICHELELVKKKESLKNFSEQLEEKKQELQKAHTFNKNLLSITSHDLSSPLNAVSGYLELMNDCFGDGSKFDQIEGYHERIQLGVQDVMDMLKQLTDISRIERGSVSADMVRINAPWLVKDVVELIKSNAFKKNIDFSIDITEASAYINADIVKLKRVIYNLVTNAIKYVDEGGTVKVKVRASEDKVLIDICDDGIGIPKSQQSKIFSPFVKFNANPADAYTSCGLGLYLASYFMDLMNGDISLESEEGVGSTFTLSLPLEKNVEFKHEYA